MGRNLIVIKSLTFKRYYSNSCKLNNNNNNNINNKNNDNINKNNHNPASEGINFNISNPLDKNKNMIVYIDMESNKKNILEENKGKPGIYMIRLFSSLVLKQSHLKLNPYWLAGFIDAEGSFIISISKNLEFKTGWRVKAIFSITLHEKDRLVLELIQKYFEVGYIIKQGKDSVMFLVTSLADLINVIIPYFDKFSLITQKRGDFELFKMVIEIMSRKEHLTAEGLQAIINIRANLNRGLPTELKIAFPNTIPVMIPLVQDQTIRDSCWLAGFASGEACFFVNIYRSKTKLGEAVQLRFQITPLRGDEQLMKSLIDYLGCGYYSIRKNKLAGDFLVIKFSGIVEKIIPFFDKNQIIGKKVKDFEDFKQVAFLMKDQTHKTPEGLEKIREIKKGMNRGSY